MMQIATCCCRESLLSVKISSNLLHSKCTDLMDLGRSTLATLLLPVVVANAWFLFLDYRTYSEGALRIKANSQYPLKSPTSSLTLFLFCIALIMGVESDSIIPLVEQQHIFHLLQGTFLLPSW